MKHHTHAAGVEAGPGVTAEPRRRAADRFQVSSITLALFLPHTAAEAVAVTIVPRSVAVACGVASLAGWAASRVLGVWTTSRGRPWGRVALCAIPASRVPAGLARALIRRRGVGDEVPDELAVCA